MSRLPIKVLFFAEGATLAHVVRPFALARELDPQQFDVSFCRPPAFRWLTKAAPFRIVNLDCQDAAIFARRLKYGSPLYDLPTLKRYVEDDLALIDELRPDVIVGDFRLSLSVSARLRKVPYITLCDAHWSPEGPFKPPFPVLPLTAFMPIATAEWLSRRVAPLVFRLHVLPMERLRAHYSLPSLGYDLRACYTDADFRLYANFPLLFPAVKDFAAAAFIGPITWFPSLSADVESFDRGKPLIYVTMGSSGNAHVLETIIPVLERTPHDVVVATAGRSLSFKPASSRTRVYDFLPGSSVCQRARLVVCNGGSAMTNQALANGVPVLGIAQNMDQFFNMGAIEDFGAGLLVRADRASASTLSAAAARLLHEDRFVDRARELARSVGPESPGSLLARHIIRLCQQAASAV